MIVYQCFKLYFICLVSLSGLSNQLDHLLSDLECHFQDFESHLLVTIRVPQFCYDTMFAFCHKTVKSVKRLEGAFNKEKTPFRNINSSHHKF